MPLNWISQQWLFTVKLIDATHSGADPEISERGGPEAIKF